MDTSIALSASVIEIARAVVQSAHALLVKEPRLNLDQAFWRTGNASPVYGLLTHLVLDKTGKTMYGVIEANPHSSYTLNLLQNIDTSLYQAGEALRITSRRFSQDDIGKLQGLRRRQLGRTPQQQINAMDKLEKARNSVRLLASASGRQSLLQAVLNATGTANVPQAVSDAAMVLLVRDIAVTKSQLSELSFLAKTWDEFRLHN